MFTPEMFADLQRKFTELARVNDLLRAEAAMTQAAVARIRVAVAALPCGKDDAGHCPARCPGGQCGPQVPSPPP